MPLVTFVEVERHLICGYCSPPPLTSILDHVTLTVGHATQAVGHVTLPFGHVTPAVGHVTVVFGHVTLTVGHVTQVVGHVTLAVGRASQAVDYVTGRVNVVSFWEGGRGGVVGMVDEEWQVYRQLF